MGMQAPSTRIGFGGLVSSGPATDRPSDSSIRCRDFRIMPPAPNGKPYLRLRAGRTFRLSPPASFNYFRFYQWDSDNGTKNIALCLNGAAGKWQTVNMTASPYVATDILTASSGLNSTSPISAVRNKFFLANGLGIRGGGISQPPLCSWDGTTVRYVGLDAYCPNPALLPTAAFAIGAGLNNIISRVDIWVGLYNSTTTHYSNAVFAGRLANPGAGTITVNNLSRLSFTYNNATEHNELFYVYYASLDGGETAYLILNSALNGPLTTAVGTASQSLSVTALDPQGFLSDLTQERPTENFPPRVMDRIAYANGRVYGILSATNDPTKVYLPNPDGSRYTDFSYQTAKVADRGSIVWTASAADQTDRDFVGAPEEAWPVKNRKFTPNGRPPLIIDAAPGGNQVLVLTTTGTYLLYESADGLHQWVTVSDTDGIGQFYTQSYVRTPRGPMWITADRQIVLLDKSTFALQVLDSDFSDYLADSAYVAIGAADYLRDPQNSVDRYEVWGSGRSLCYDFAIGGQAYDTVCPTVYAAATMRDASGNRHHVIAFGGSPGPVLSHEADPYTGVAATRDQLGAGIFTDINGEWISQWLSYGDARDRKSLTDIDIIGDGELTPALGGVNGTRPLTVSYFTDFDPEEHGIDLEKSLQSANNQDHNYKGRTGTANPFWIKFRLQLAGHGADQATYPANGVSTGEIPPSFYGCIYDFSPTIMRTGNRP